MVDDCLKSQCVSGSYSYIRFSAICASAVRAALKPQLKAEAIRAAETNVRVLRQKTACKSMCCNKDLCVSLMIMYENMFHLL